MQSCASNADCREREGYLCDPQWKACIVPNSATLVPRTCPATTPARDLAFGTSTQLTTAASSGSYQQDPSAVLTPTGALAIVFGTRGAPGGLQALGHARLGGDPTIIDGVFAPATGTRGDGGSDPWLARDASGTLYAVWLAAATEAAPPQIKLARSTNVGVTWSAPMVASSPGDCTGGADCLARPMVVVGADPAAKTKQILYVIYGAAGGLRVRASRDGGATLTTAVTALEGSLGSAAISSDGRLHLLSLVGGPSTGAFGSAAHRIDYAVSTTGGRSFSRPKRLSGRDEMLPFYFAAPGIATDSARKWLYAAYVRGGRDAVWDLVLLASKDSGATWKRTRLGDAPGCAIHMVPSLALDPRTGALHIAWYDNRGGSGRFAHASCTPGLAKCTQHGAINDLPFAALTTERHAARWIGEHASLVIDDKRRTLHAVWTQPVVTAGATAARIFHAQAKLPRR